MSGEGGIRLCALYHPTTSFDVAPKGNIKKKDLQIRTYCICPNECKEGDGPPEVLYICMSVPRVSPYGQTDFMD